MHLRDAVRGSFGRPLALLLPGLILGTLAGCSEATGPSPSPSAEPSLQFINLFQPVDLTPDGSMAVMQDLGGDVYFYHTATDVLEFKTNVGDPGQTRATRVSGNGVLTAFHGNPVHAGFWTERGGWTDLFSPFPVGCFTGVGEDTGSAWDVSANGQIIVGLAWDGCGVAAFRWDATGSGVMTLLERIGGTSSPDRAPDNRASVVSDDGTMAAGWAETSLAYRSPAAWRPDGTGFLLPGPQDLAGEVYAISPDGKTLGGLWGQNAFYWSEATGTVDIGRLPDAGEIDPAWVGAIAADSKLMFGVCGLPFWGTPRAFVWTAAGGMRLLADVVTAAGVTIPEGYTLTNVLSASADGKIVLGQATTADFHTVSFVLKLPVSAYGL